MASLVSYDILMEFGLDITVEESYVFVLLLNYIMDRTTDFESTTFGSLDVVNQALFSFRAMFREYFRSSPYIDLPVAYNEAYSQLVNAALNQQISDEELTQLYFQVQTETHWIERINMWRRAKFVESAMQDATGMPKLMLGDRFPNGGLRYYNQDELFNTADGMLQITVNTFAQHFPLFEDQIVVGHWCDQLYHRLTEIISEAVLSNKTNMEHWDKIVQIAAAKYVELMNEQLATHPYLGHDKVETLHQQAKIHAESLLGFHKAIWNHMMKLEWDLKINTEYERLKAEWESSGNVRIATFLNDLQVACARISYQHFNADVVSSGSIRLVEFNCETDSKVWWTTLENLAVSP